MLFQQDHYIRDKKLHHYLHHCVWHRLERQRVTIGSFRPLGSPACPPVLPQLTPSFPMPPNSEANQSWSRYPFHHLSAFPVKKSWSPKYFLDLIGFMELSTKHCWTFAVLVLQSIYSSSYSSSSLVYFARWTALLWDSRVFDFSLGPHWNDSTAIPKKKVKLVVSSPLDLHGRD